MYDEGRVWTGHGRDMVHKGVERKTDRCLGVSSNGFSIRHVYDGGGHVQYMCHGGVELKTDRCLGVSSNGFSIRHVYDGGKEWGNGCGKMDGKSRKIE